MGFSIQNLIFLAVILARHDEISEFYHFTLLGYRTLPYVHIRSILKIFAIPNTDIECNSQYYITDASRIAILFLRFFSEIFLSFITRLLNVLHYIKIFSCYVTFNEDNVASRRLFLYSKFYLPACRHF